MSVPRLVVTSGEPAGIGPELCLRAALRDWPSELIFVADPQWLQATAQALGISVSITAWQPGQAAVAHVAGSMPVLSVPLRQAVVAGRPDVANAASVLAMLDCAVDGCLDGTFDAMVTAPLQKSVIAEAGHAFTGHTEYLARRCGNARALMLLVAGTLRVALATTHVPLSEVPRSLSPQLLDDILAILDRDLRGRLGISQPRIAVCGLNPHAGEGGHLGHEDAAIIAPAIARAVSAGMKVHGPVPADTAFTPAALAQCDCVLAMYHDQGLPVLKYAGFGRAVNVTLGLALTRTSVDHGTALDIAGQGRADPGSLFEAIALAQQLADG